MKVGDHDAAIHAFGLVDRNDYRALDLAQFVGDLLVQRGDAGAPIDDESDLPRSVSLVSLLGTLESDSPEAVVERWRENGSLIVRDGRQPQPVDNPVELRAIVGHAGLERIHFWRNQL